MKTTPFHKASATVFVMAVLAVVSVNPVFAQRRTREYQPQKREHSNKGKENKHNRSGRDNEERGHNRDHWVEKSRQHRDHDRNYAYHEPRYDRHFHEQDRHRGEHWNNDRRWEREHPFYAEHRHYRIPRYNGRVRVYARAPWGRHRHPVVIRHRDRDIYWYGGNFYTYYPRYGYVQIEVPRSMAFTTIPRGAVRVRVNGHLMFRLGDLYFELGTGGYHLANYNRYPQLYGYIDRY